MLFLKKYFWEIILLLITFLAAVLRLHMLGEYTVDRDEYARVVPEFTFTSLIPPGIIFLTKLSASFFNYSDFGFRLPIFLFGVLGVVLIYYLGKTYFGKLEGILAAFVTSLLLTHIGYSNQVKEYIPLMTFATLSSILVFKIISHLLDQKKIPKKLLFLYTFTSALALLFSSYFYSLVLLYQIIITISVIISVNLKRFSFTRFLLSFPTNILITIGALFIIFSTFYVFIRINAYFGVKISIPTLSFISNYWQELGYFVTQDTLWTKVFNAIFLASIIPLLALKKYQRGAAYIISFTALDFLLTASLKFSHSAFPFHYIRYHAFLLPTYVLMVTGVVGGSGFLLKKRYSFIYFLIILSFLYFNAKRAYPMIRWYYEAASVFIRDNFKDDGAYLTANLQRRDTLVRVKNLGMDHKFNHVNHYIDPNVLKNINYSIFPERTAKNNWYVPLGVGDEDEQGFSGYLDVGRVRPSLRSNTPLVSKLKYYGPFLRTRPLEDKESWGVRASASQETAHLAVDLNVNTVWESSSEAKNSFSIDLGSVHFLNSVRFIFYPTYPKEFTLFLSEDSFSKRQVFDYNPSNPASYPNSQFFFPPTKVRFIEAEIKNAGIGEIDVWEVYEDTIDVNKDEVSVGESLVKYNFNNSLDGWINDEGIGKLLSINGELSGTVLSESKDANISVSLDSEPNQATVNFVNFALRANKGKRAVLLLKTQDKIFPIDNIELISDGFLNYYSLNLDDYGIPQEDRNKIRTLTLFPSDVYGAEFGLDFLSLDTCNLPGIQLKDKESPNGFTQYIPYKKDDDYTFFQIGDKLNLPKGRYIASFKIKVDKTDYGWKMKRQPTPAYRLYDYLEPKETSDSDILCVSLESTRGTFYNSPAYLIIHGEEFKEANKYYEFSMPFKSDGSEKLFFQAFSPKDRRYPANLFITFPQVERVK